MDKTIRELAEEAWVQHVATLRQRLFFETEREQWIQDWIKENDGWKSLLKDETPF